MDCIDLVQEVRFNFHKNIQRRLWRAFSLFSRKTGSKFYKKELCIFLIIPFKIHIIDNTLSRSYKKCCFFNTSAVHTG